MNDQEKNSLATLATDVMDKAATFYSNRAASEYLVSVHETLWKIIKGEEFKLEPKGDK